MNRALLSHALVALVAISATVGLIYLTPLRYSRFIPPSIREIAPKSFYGEFRTHPNIYEFIDVRSTQMYNQQHAAGSINIPLASLYDQWPTLPRSGKTIVLICGSNSASGVAYAYLEHQGFSNLMRVTGGVPAWILSGLPTEGTKASSVSIPI